MTPERWQQVKQIFQSALERNPAERSAFVAQVCGHDAILRNEVESLISSYDQTGDSVEAMAADAATELLADDQAGRIVGKQIGHYQVLTRIGRGGMGEVFLAEDTSLGRRVALKLLRGEFTTNEERLRRFRHEARAASALNHPNILTIYEIGQEHSLHFMATEYVEGETLRQHITAGRLTPGQTLDVAVQVASALAAAHQAGIIHRDIKPENIMVRTDGYVKVLDFGLAKLAEIKAVDTVAPTLPNVETEPGVVMGTVSYMSPEQARGQTVDARTDVWSLGAVIYEMASGHQPFEGETASDVISLILQKEPVPLVQLSPEVPGELERIVRKALRKNKNERYQTIDDLMLDLKSLTQRLSFEAQLERSATPNERTVKGAFISKSSNRAYVYGGVGAVLVVVLITLYLFFGPKHPSIENKSVAVLPFVNMSADKEEEYFSDGLTEELINVLTKVEGLRVPARTSAFAFKDKQQDIRKIGEQLNVSAVLEGSVRKAGNKLRITAQLINVADGFHLWSETFDRDMQDVFAIQDDISRRIVDTLKIKLTGEQTVRLTKRYTENTEAYQSYLKGRYYWSKKTDESLKKGLEYFKQSLDQDPTFALAYVGMADDYMMMGGEYYVLASSEVRPLAKASALRALELDPNLGEAHTSLALWNFHQFDWTTAEEEFKHALVLAPNYAPAHHWYAHLLSSERRFDEALNHIRRAQELDPLALNFRGSEGIILFTARRYDEALETLNKLAASFPDFTGGYSWRAMVFVETKRFPQAISDVERTISLTDRNSSERLGKLGYVYGSAGRKADALKIAEELDELSKQRYVSPFYRALVPLGLGDKDQALFWLQKAYEERDASVSVQNASPVLDSIRDDPRFQDLQRRISFHGK